jgi:hypothetical protein
MVTIVGSATVIPEDAGVQDVRCFCFEVVVFDKVSLHVAKAALAHHIREPKAHGTRFAKAMDSDLVFEPSDPSGRVNIQWVPQ